MFHVFSLQNKLMIIFPVHWEWVRMPNIYLFLIKPLQEKLKLVCVDCCYGCLFVLLMGCLVSLKWILISLCGDEIC